MKFYLGQFVTRNDDPEIGVLGRISRVKRHTATDFTGERYSIHVRWANGYRSIYSGAQLRVVCPTCAGKTRDFDAKQCKRLKLECDICNQKARP